MKEIVSPLSSGITFPSAKTIDLRYKYVIANECAFVSQKGNQE